MTGWNWPALNSSGLVHHPISIFVPLIGHIEETVKKHVFLSGCIKVSQNNFWIYFRKKPCIHKCRLAQVMRVLHKSKLCNVARKAIST